MFVQDLIRSSIRLDDDSATPTLGTLPDDSGMAPTEETNLETPAGPTGQAREPGWEVAAITEPSISDADWRKPIFEYLWL
jgi:hypothetical protein